MEKLHVIKIGGNVIDDESKLQVFLKDFAGISGLKILVHGGGKSATDIAGKLNIPQQLKDGRRLTDAETLKIIIMVYAGYINKTITAQLQSMGCNAMGFCGVDGNALMASKRLNENVDYGFVGDPHSVNSALFKILLDQSITPVIAPVTHDGKGQLLNTNADTIAKKIAKSLRSDYEVHLIYCFEKEGVLLQVDNENEIKTTLNSVEYHAMKSEKKIFAGMIPKMENAFDALHSGVKAVVIGNAEKLDELIKGSAGTSIVHD